MYVLFYWTINNNNKKPKYLSQEISIKKQLINLNENEKELYKSGK